MSKILLMVWFAPRNAAIAIMKVYRRVVSPMYGEVCRYYPSCSRYSMEAYQQRGFLVGLALTIWRLLRCNPYTQGGIDDAPPSRNPNFELSTGGFVRPAHSKGLNQ